MSRKKPLFSNPDYQYSSLPATRKEAFKDVYHNNFKTILSSGVMLMLFSIPLLVFLFVMDIGKFGMTPDRFSEEELRGVLLLWDLIVNGGAIILLYAVLIGLMGIMRVLKLLVWQEGIDFFHDFKVGVKENFKHFSLLYLVFAILYVASYLVYIFLLNFLVGIWLMFIYVIVFVSMGIWGLFVINVYQCNFWNYLKNALFFYTKSFYAFLSVKEWDQYMHPIRRMGINKFLRENEKTFWGRMIVLLKCASSHSYLMYLIVAYIHRNVFEKYIRKRILK